MLHSRQFKVWWTVTIATLAQGASVQTQIPPRLETQVIKIRLTNLAEVSEWVRLEVTGRHVKLLHTTVAPSEFAKALSVAAGVPSAFSDSITARAVGVFAGFPAIAHTWYDHPTTGVFFQPEGCDQPSCTITGTNTLELPEGIDLLRGQFTIQYTESNLQRSVTFKVPQR